MPVPTISVVVPCYNEEEVLLELHRRLSDVCVAVCGSDYELVFVNDGSRDRTWEIMCQIGEHDPHVVAVNLSRNHGHQLALSAGLTVAQGDRILILDADLQDPPELLGEMMSIMDQGYDVVYGQRTNRPGETKFKLISAGLFYRVLRWLSEVDIPVDTGDFRLINRRALDVLLSMPERYRFIRGMVSWIGFRQKALVYERAARFGGSTKYPLGKMIRIALDALTGFSIRPLRAASYLGLATGAVGLGVLAYVLTSWLLGHAVVGWTSVMVVVLLMGSAQLFVVGLLGEYLGRLYMEAKRRPLFVIESIVRAEPTAPTATEAVTGTGSWPR